METISIKDEDGKVYEFEKPRFECELLKVVDGMIVMYYKTILGTMGARILTSDGTSTDESFSLTPIKPKWYEDESNFPMYITPIDSDSMTNPMILTKPKHYSNIGNPHLWRLATKEEVQSLYYEGK